MLHMTVIERIDELRTMREWSVNNLAMEAMLTQSTLNNLYMRNAEPKLSTLRSVCGAFGITLAEFFAETEQKEESKTDAELKTRIAALSEEEKNAVLVLLRAIQNKRNG